MTLTWEHLQRKTLLKLTNTKEKLNSTPTTEEKAEHNYALVNQAINIHKSNKGVTNLKTPQQKD